MIPPAFITFFAASLAADGALIGLLFVAIAIEPGQTFGVAANQERELAANGAFAGLVNAFLISMLALIPKLNIGFAVVVIAAFSLLNTVVHVVDKLQRGNSAYARSLFYTIGGLLVYGLEIFYGSQLIRQPGATDAVVSLILVLIAEYAVALARAWTLLGAERRSFIRVLLDAIQGRRSHTPASAPADDEKSTPPV